MPVGRGGGGHPTLLTPSPLPTGISVVLSPVSLTSRDQDGGSSDSTIDICLRSHGKIGEQSIQPTAKVI